MAESRGLGESSRILVSTIRRRSLIQHQTAKGPAPRDVQGGASPGAGVSPIFLALARADRVIPLPYAGPCTLLPPVSATASRHARGHSGRTRFQELAVAGAGVKGDLVGRIDAVLEALPVHI